MNQEERINFLLDYLCEEYNKTSNIIEIPNDYNQKKLLFRSLINVRPPRPVSDDFLNIQDIFLKEEIKQKGIVSFKNILPCDLNKRISLWQGDITLIKVGAIVNAANSELLGCFFPKHHCIDNAIHTYAGVGLRYECHNVMQQQGHSEATGKAKITKAYNLPSQFVIHTVGPIVKKLPTDEQIKQLTQCYKSCLDLVIKNGVTSIAFCCISTGLFAFPKELAASIAIDTVNRYLENETTIERVVFNVFTNEDFGIYKKLLFVTEKN